MVGCLGVIALLLFLIAWQLGDIESAIKKTKPLAPPKSE